MGNTSFHSVLHRSVPLVSLLTLLCLSPPLAAAESDHQWQNLKGLEKSNVYTILLRDKTCRSGRLNNVCADKLNQNSIAIPRPEVMFVGEGLSAAEVLFSGRSSWKDVMSVDAEAPEKLRIWLKAGPSLSGANLASSQTDLMISVSGKPARVPKSAIARVEYIRFKPVPEAHRHFAQAGHGFHFLDPKVWQYALRISAMISVPIYDSTLSENDSPLACTEEATRY